MGNIVTDALYVMVFGALFFILVACCEWLFIKAYKHIPAFAKWWDNFCKYSSDWDNEGEIE